VKGYVADTGDDADVKAARIRRRGFVSDV